MRNDIFQIEYKAHNSILKLVYKMIALLNKIILGADFVLLLFKIQLSKPSMIYMGDSHAYYLSGNTRPIKKFSLNKSGVLTIWIGPKLLYTIANQGFLLDKRMKIVLMSVRNSPTIVFILGEIDCRVHFVKKTLVLGDKEFDSVALKYKSIITQFVTDNSLGKCIVLAPFPQSDFGLGNPRIQRDGALSERVLVTKKITDSLLKISSENFIVIDNSNDLSDQNHSLEKKYTDDDVHLNSLGIQIVKDEITLRI